MCKQPLYRQPGSGALEFIRQYVEHLSRHQALSVVKRILRGELHDTSDKRIKRCQWCGYWFRDKTRPNNSRCCSRDCKISSDTDKRRKKKEKELLLKPNTRKKSKRELNYVYWLEYPYWLNEYEMLKYSWKYEASCEPTKMEEIVTAKGRTDKMGGRKTPKRKVEF